MQFHANVAGIETREEWQRQIQDGVYNVVAPSEWASHKVNHPRKAPQ